MSISDDDFNAFSINLARRFAERAQGSDQTASRLVGQFPRDTVLCGFLTPASRMANQPEPSSKSAILGPISAGNDLDSLSEDLPQDSAYEQSSLGLQWKMPREACEMAGAMVIEFSASIYVRRLPTLVEQSGLGAWRREYSSSKSVDESVGSNDTGIKTSEIVPVWTREDVTGLLVPEIDIRDLCQRKKITMDLSQSFRRYLDSISHRDLYPGVTQLQVSQENVKSNEKYSSWLRSLGMASLRNFWSPVLDVRIVPIPTEPECARVVLRVINRTEAPGRSEGDFLDPNLYRVRLNVVLPASAHRFSVFRELPKSFRYDRRMAGIGINCHVRHDAQNGNVILSTDATPIESVYRLEPREIPDGAPTFDSMRSDPIHTLQSILTAMKSYDRIEWRDTLSGLTGKELTDASEARKRFRDEIQRFSRGIKLLADDSFDHVLRAFVLMNEAMEAAADGRYDRWRLFQIVFIVSQIPGLASREYEEIREEHDDDVDILWFAAGGGKTEAFLGLLIWQAFFDRLRGKRIGVTAFVRFPLRLLTFQQLQRLGSALGSAELIRHRERLGGARFSMGYFVGSGTTPNRIDDDAHRRFVTNGPDDKLRRVFACPFCGCDTVLSYDASNRIVEHRCTSDSCPGGQNRLPIYVVDQDVYRFVPTVIVSTVDKLAQFGQNQRFSELFGRFDLVCPTHGTSFLDSNRICSAAVAYAAGETPESCGAATNRIHYGPFKDPAPSLLIQDEMHLLSEELGTFDSHYETAIMNLAYTLGSRPWKIIAATATIERYKTHAWHLYLRQSRQFPGPGPGAYESFYYAQNRAKLGRVFVGVLGVGRKHTPAVTRTLSLLYEELQLARHLADTDTAAMADRYGLGDLSKDDSKLLVFYYELVLSYVLTRKGSDQVAEAIESRVKRELQRLAPEHGDLLVTTFNGGISESEMSRIVHAIRTADPLGDPAKRTRGIVTTNVIGHGVDVDRFNIIVFAGFPRLVAEYIQASARVGRTVPGISLFVATPQSERDRSVFDRFCKFHEYLDRLVDPSAIIRWPEPALRRTSAGILAGYLMAIAARHIRRRIVSVADVQDLQGSENAEALEVSEIIAWMNSAYGTDLAPSRRYREQLEVVVRNHYSSIVNQERVHGRRPVNLNSHLSSMRSLRDSDDPGFITIWDSADKRLIQRLSRGQ